MRYLSLFIGLIYMSACSYELPDVSETSDSFSDDTFARFYVVGDGFSAGMMNGVLTSENQSYSYPALLGSRINSYFDADLFRQADVETDHGVNRFETGERGPYRLYYREPGDAIPARQTLNAEPPGAFKGETDQIRNFSFPGLRATDVDQVVGDLQNLYLNRLSISNEQSLLDIIALAEPAVTLISLGYDDLLPYVHAGATGSFDGELTELSESDATPVTLFESSYRNIFENIQDNSSSVILATIPDPLLSPAFTTISYSMELGSEITPAEIGQLNAFYRQFNERVFEYNLGDTITAENRRPFIDFDVDGGAQFKARVVEDPTLTDVVFDDGYRLPKIRQMDENEFLPFRFEQIFFENPYYGKTEPIKPQDVIKNDDAERIRQLLAGYNAVIRDLAASSNNIYLLDVEQLISELHEGTLQDSGVFYNADFSRESLYSADGLFLNPKGHAMVAKRLVELLNREFDVSLTPIEVNDNPGLTFGLDF